MNVNKVLPAANEMQLIGEKLQKKNKELNRRLKTELDDKLLDEN